MNNIDYDTLVENRPSVEELMSYIQDPHFFSLPEDIHPRVQAKKLDKIIGFRIPKIERDLLKKYRAYYQVVDETDRKQHYQGTQTWIGLHPQVLQTPYSEILHFFWLIRKHEIKKVVDLGAGYGRLAIVMKSLFPEAAFSGYEIVPVRINEARRVFDFLALPNCSMIEENILSDEFNLPPADLYFIYDFSDPKDVRQILKKLAAKISSERFFIVAKGEGVRSLIQLKFPEFWAAHGVVHKKNWSLYSSFVDLA